MSDLSLLERIRRWPTLRSRHWLALFLERAEQDRNVVAMIVIGSTIRREVVSEDLDLLVLCHDVKLLKEKAPIEVDLLRVNIACAEEKIENGHDLLTWAVRFGQPLLDKDHVWDGIVRRWKDRAPLPDPAVAAERARAARRRLEKMRDSGNTDACAELEVSYQTHRARACLAKAGVYPTSRPELSSQLRELGEVALAVDLERALVRRMHNTAA